MQRPLFGPTCLSWTDPLGESFHPRPGPGASGEGVASGARPPRPGSKTCPTSEPSAPTTRSATFRFPSTYPTVGRFSGAQ